MRNQKTGMGSPRVDAEATFPADLGNEVFIENLEEEPKALLQFFLNHRRYLRSEHREGVDKSPTELSTGEPHRHWLELLGHTRFVRS